jgi:hypothetical protein
VHSHPSGSAHGSPLVLTPKTPTFQRFCLSALSEALKQKALWFYVAVKESALSEALKQKALWFYVAVKDAD